MLVDEFYISAVRIELDYKGDENITYLRAHAKYGPIVKEIGQALTVDMVISMMQTKPFYTALWNPKQKKWVQGDRLYWDQHDQGYYLATDSELKIFDLYELPRF